MKKILAVILALFTLTVTACSSGLAPQEYADQLTAIEEEYQYQTSSMTYLVHVALSGGTTPDYSTVPEIADKMESCLSEAEKLDPPAKYRDLHNEMCASMELERGWINVLRRMETEGFSEELNDQLNEYADRDFNNKCLDILAGLQNDGMNIPSETIKGLIVTW